MTRRRGSANKAGQEPGVSAGTPAQQDEADILAEAGAERDESSGELLVDEAKILELGAVDAASVRENRRLDDIVDKKRANQKDVPFNTGDLLTQYETLIRYWPANTLDISVKRMTGTPVQQVITSRPRSGAELYEAIKVIHGNYGEAEYEVKFLDTNRKQYRGTSRIVMPDTRVPSQQGQQPPMNAPYYPNGAPQQGYPPQPAFGYPQQPQQQQTQQPQPAPQPMPQPQHPVVVQAPAGPDMSSMIGAMRELFGIFQSMQPPAPPAPAQPVYAPQPVYAQPHEQQPVAMPPMPPPGADMATMMDWTRQMFGIFQSMQPPAPAQAAPAPAAPTRGHMPRHAEQPVASPMTGMMGMPPAQPPPGMIFVPGIGYVAFDALMRAINPQQEQPAPRAPYRPQQQHPAYGDRDRDQGGPPYRGDQGGPPYPSSRSAHQPPPSYQQQPAHRQPTSAEQFREAISVVRTAQDMVQELREMLPGSESSGGGYAPQQQEEDDDSPISVIDTGPAKIVINKKDGTLRGWETGFANLDKIFKFAGEQGELIRTASERRQQRQQQQQPQRALPPGYVEVGPDYRAPPGYVAVPVDHSGAPIQQAPMQQQGLPPAPQVYSPQIESIPPPQPGRRTWEAPSIPEFPEEGQG